MAFPRTENARTGFELQGNAYADVPATVRQLGKLSCIGHTDTVTFEEGCYW